MKSNLEKTLMVIIFGVLGIIALYVLYVFYILSYILIGKLLSLE